MTLTDDLAGLRSPLHGSAEAYSDASLGWWCCRVRAARERTGVV